MNIKKLYVIYKNQVEELENKLIKYGKADLKFRFILIRYALVGIIEAFDDESSEYYNEFKELSNKCTSIIESL